MQYTFWPAEYCSYVADSLPKGHFADENRPNIECVTKKGQIYSKINTANRNRCNKYSLFRTITFLKSLLVFLSINIEK